jgi:hypothetical protein
MVMRYALVSILGFICGRDFFQLILECSLKCSQTFQVKFVNSREFAWQQQSHFQNVRNEFE